MPEQPSYTADDLIRLEPQHDFFVGIDSDGCVFDTMTAKQQTCFQPLIVSQWHLEAIAPYVRETSDFVNLNSKWRGRNRFLSLLMLFDLLRERPQVKASNARLPQCSSLRAFIDSGVPLGNQSLSTVADASGDDELVSILEWSLAVNADIAENVRDTPPFKEALVGLDAISSRADAVVVSQTPIEALEREWAACGLASRVRAIAGQELGTKTEHIEMATRGKYPPRHVLMIGDAPGDRIAATANGAMFYPINPGAEEASWKRFHEEAFAKFLAEDYEGAYEEALVEEFESALPATPPWLSPPA